MRPAKPVTYEAEVAFGKTVLHYHVVRSTRRKKTIEITVLPDAGMGPHKRVRVAAPWRAPEGRIREVVLSRAAWVLRALARAPRQPKAKSFQTGEAFSYLGRKVSLEVVLAPAARPAVALRRGSLRVTVPAAHPEPERAPLVHAVLRDWYRRRASDRLTAAVERWGRTMGLNASRILVGDQRTLWGSCAADGTIRFSWRSVQVAPALMDYIVVHELAHLKHRSHGPRFWREVARYIPDYLKRRERLREAGRELGW